MTLFNRSSGTAQLIADVSGYYVSGKASAPGAFQPVAASRFLDTRATKRAAAADGEVSFQVGGVKGIPKNVSAVVFNLTVTEAKSFGFVTAHASGTTRPQASNINYDTGQTRANLVTVPVGADGKVTLFNRSSGTAQLIVDVSGYYISGEATTPGSFQPVTASRFLDTRGTKRAAADGPVSFQVGSQRYPQERLRRRLQPHGNRNEVIRLCDRARIRDQSSRRLQHQLRLRPNSRQPRQRAGRGRRQSNPFSTARTKLLSS